MDRSNERWEGKSGEAEDRGRTTATPSTPLLAVGGRLVRHRRPLQQQRMTGDSGTISPKRSARWPTYPMDGLSFLFEAVASGVGNTWKNKTACLPTCLVGWLTTLVVFPQLVSFPSSPQIGEVVILFMLDGSDWALGELLSYRC
jgi:hypothetical protein